MEELYINNVLLSHQDKKKNLRNFIQKNEFKINFIYDSDFKSAKILRDYIEVVWSLLWIDTKRKSRLILITDEMNNNAIEYGSKKWEKNCMRLEIKNKKNEIYIRIETEDNGSWINPKSVEEMEKMKEEKIVDWFKNHQSIRWRWLFLIILNLVDNLYFKNNERGGLIVGIEKTLFKD